MIFIGYLLAILIFIVAIFFIWFILKVKHGDRKSLNTKLISLIILFLSIPISLHFFDMVDYVAVNLIIIIFILSLIGLKLVDFISTKIEMKSPSMKKEFFRKMFHLVGFVVFIDMSTLSSVLRQGFSIILPGILKIFGLETGYQTFISLKNETFLAYSVVSVIVSFFFIATVLEFVRLGLGIRVFPDILIRGNEKEDIAAELFIAIGLFFVAINSSWIVFSAVASSVLLGDAAAAIIGKLLGKRSITNNKTLEGTLAEFFVSFLSAFFFVGLFPSLLCAVFIVISDIFISSKIDDNLLFPLVAYTGIVFGLMM